MLYLFPNENLCRDYGSVLLQRQSQVQLLNVLLVDGMVDVQAAKWLMQVPLTT